MNEKISRISLIIYVFLLILIGFIPAVSGGLVGLLCIMGIFAILPIVKGPKRYRIIGIIALLIAVALAANDYHAGKSMQQRFDENRKQHEKDVKPEVNSPSSR